MKTNRRSITYAFGILIAVVLFVMLRSLVEQKRNRAIVTAIQEYNLTEVQSLKAKGARSDGDMNFLIAILSENPVEVKRMIANGADTNARSTNGNTPLIYAVNGSTFEIIKILIEHGAQINARGEGGATALMSAVQCNDAKVVKMLLDSGTKVNIQNDFENTALDCVEPGFGVKDAAIISKLLKHAGAKSYVWSNK